MKGTIRHLIRRVALGLALVCVATPLSHSQDTATVGTVTAAGGTVVVPLSVRDASSTPLGVDQSAGNRIQGLSFRVSYSPAAAVSAVTFTRAGITASLTPLFETSLSSGNTISYIGSFSETTNLIPFVSNAAAPGDQVLQLTFTLSASATPGTVITLTIDPSPSVTALSNQSGTVSETTANGNLTLVDGSITVPLQAPTVTGIAPNIGPVTGGTSVSITGTDFQAGANVSLGGVAATGVSVVSSTSIMAITGAHAAGLVDVLVTNPDGQSGTLVNGFTYQPVSTGSADLSVSKTDSPDPATVGEGLTYTVTAANAGPDAASGVILTDTLPSTVSFSSASVSQGTSSLVGSVWTWDIGSIASGASATATITVIPAAGGAVSNTASVAGGQSDPDTANNSATATTTVIGGTGANADLSISKSGSPDPVTAGSQLSYELGVRNSGPDGANAVVLTDALPAGVNFVSATASQGSCTQADKTITCNLGSLADGAIASATIVTMPTAAGVVTNTATVGAVESDPNTMNNTASATITVIASESADITAQWGKIRKVGKGRVIGRFRVLNVGSQSASQFRVEVFYSPDATISRGDKYLGSWKFSGMAAGASSKSLVVRTSVSRKGTGQYLIAAVDRENEVPEANESNNIVPALIPK